MIQLTVLYGHPRSSEAFDRHYRENHAPLARKLPRLKGYTTTRPASLNPEEASPYYLIANLYFASTEDFQEALSSAEGQAAAGDLASFANGGATLLVGEVELYEPVVIG
jgi:uncharacterized protein (TIGR02118 family)